MADCTQHLSCDSKVQAIRVVDVFLLGPAMMLVGAEHGGMVGNFVTLSGAGTIVFNLVRLLTANHRKAVEQ